MYAPLTLRQTPTAEHDGCRLELEGELDVASAPEFRRVVGSLLGVGCRRVVVDLAGTTFLDSSGLGALVWASHRLHAAGGVLEVINAGERIAQMMRITGVDRLLA